MYTITNMLEHTIANFDKGLITSFEAHSIPEGAASDSLNWLTRGDKIELTGGYTIIGAEDGVAGKVTGLGVSNDVNGDPVAFKTQSKKLFYYDGNDWVENGVDLLGDDADGEAVQFSPYTSVAGYQMWASSPNSGLFKIMLANPADAKDMFINGKNFKGSLTHLNGRALMWYTNKTRNTLFGSWLDAQDESTYTLVADEAVGALGVQAYNGNLAEVTGKRTGHAIIFSDGTQTLQDDRNGNLIGDGTGTINYTTGAYTVNFAAVTAGAVVVSYEHEDSTDKGVADFSESAIRKATEGFFILQATGGDLLDIKTYRTQNYCIHENNVWFFVIGETDTNPTNEVYREKLGMKSIRAAIGTGEGIYYIDTSNNSEPRFKLLTLNTSNEDVVPITVSFSVDLRNFDFSEAVSFEYGRYLLFACKTKGTSANDRVFVYDKVFKSFNLTNYFVTQMQEYAGELWAGDSVTNNVQRLFTNFTANGSNIQNYWEGNISQLGVDEIKKFKRLTIQGEIYEQQKLKVSLAYDRGEFEEIGIIDGVGDHIIQGKNRVVGGNEVGAEEIGGGGDGELVSFYKKEFRVNSQRFDEVRIRFEALDVGYVSVSTINYFDIQLYGQKNILKYRT